MRRVQIALLCLALVVFVTALFLSGAVAGNFLWQAGIAALFVDVVAIMPWPNARVGRSDRAHR